MIVIVSSIILAKELNTNAYPKARPLPPLPLPSSGPPLGTDLSTILEADTSCISKHIAPIENEDSSYVEPICLDGSFEPGRNQSSTPPPARSHYSPISSNLKSSDVDSSALDLSTSHLAGEVLDAMVAEHYAAADLWLSGANGIVVDVPADPPLDSAPFENWVPSARPLLSALDPDLAMLLIPNTVNDKEPVILETFGSITPPPLSSVGRDVDGQVASRSCSLDHMEVSPSAASRTIRPPSTPSDRSAHPSRPASARTPGSSLPRLVRPNGYLTPLSSRKGLSSARSSPARSSFHDVAQRSSMENLRPRHSRPPSPLSPTHTQRPQFEPPSRKSSYSRLFAPSRLQTLSGSAKRPQLSRLAVVPFSSRTDARSNSPTARTSSSQGTTSNSRHLLSSRPSLDSSVRPDIADRDRTFLMRTRKRSMSVEGSYVHPSFVSTHSMASITRPSTSMSSSPPEMLNIRQASDSLGPRTAKAFAAAGLLESDNEQRVHSSIHHFRFGSMRATTERDVLSRSTHSRMAYSDASDTNVSWGRSNSGSRTNTVSEADGRFSDSPTYTNTPRTTFSALSTAPTTASTFSSSQSMHVALQAMKEKHDAATEALLYALADSQRTTKILRDENEELRQQIRVLSEQFEVVVRDLGCSLRRSSSSHLATGMPPEHKSRTLSVDSPHRVPESQSHSTSKTSIATPERPSLPDRRDNVSPLKQHRRRFSAASSVFPILPTNMSMLMHEEGFSLERSHGFSVQTRSPPSPSPSSRTKESRHGHTRSLSSNGNISPSTANFSASVAGSPGSLFLRPEHEVHLGDMTNLDLSIQAM
jgi:hypothetical protein